MEDAADARHDSAYTGPYGEIRRRDPGPIDRFAEPTPADAWGKPLNEGYAQVMPGIVQKEFDLVLNPDEELGQVVIDLISEAEVRVQHSIPLMWRANGTRTSARLRHPKVLVQGPPGRLAMFEEIWRRQNTPPGDGWIHRKHSDIDGPITTWHRVIWIEAETPKPANTYCEMPGCEATESPRWAVVYRVGSERGQIPVTNEVFLYCQDTVMSDNDMATFVEEGK